MHSKSEPNSHQLIDLLASWLPGKDQGRWILGSVYRLEGSAYRKPGSFMLMNDEGTHLGLLSGGCLESDLMQKARAFAAQIDIEALGNSVDCQSPALSVRYDSTDEDDMLFQLGLGCGGVVDILLQPVHARNSYLQLDLLYQHLLSGKHSLYSQHLAQEPGQQSSFKTTGFNTLEICSDKKSLSLLDLESPFKARARLIQAPSAGLTQLSYLPGPPKLLIFGGGEDAVPLARMARQLGWSVTVVDARPSKARAEQFGTDISLINQPADALADTEIFKSIDAAVVMNHSVEMDAASLASLRNSQLAYCALLGPKHRKAEVLEKAGIVESELSWPLYGPAGLDIGADLPESIALSILAQCHQLLYKPA